MPLGMFRSQNKGTNIYHQQNEFCREGLLVHNFRRTPSEIQNWSLWGEGRTKKMAGHSRLASGRFGKKGNSHSRLVMSGPKVSRSPHAHRKFKSLHRGLNWVSHIFSPDGLNKTLPSQGYVLERAPRVKIVSNIHSKDRKSLIAQVLLKGQWAVMSSQWPPPSRVLQHDSFVIFWEKLVFII